MFEADKIAGELVEKYGQSQKNNTTLSKELEQVMSAVEHTQWSEAFRLAQNIAKSFEGADVKAIADDIYNRTINVRDTQVWVQADTVAMQKPSLVRKISANSKVGDGVVACFMLRK